MISWKKATSLLKTRLPQLEEEDDPNNILFTCYCDLALSIQQIALLCEVSPFSIRRKLLKIGIQLKGRGGARRKKTRFLKDDIEEMTTKELCKKYKVSKTTVEKARRMKREG